MQKMSTGTVSGRQQVGGLVGENTDSITNSYSTCVVTGDEAVGSLVGLNLTTHYPTIEVIVNAAGTIDSCYSAGLVTGNNNVGGLVGISSIEEQWMPFDPASIATNSLWDVVTSGRITSAAATGLTTTEMQTSSTFLEADWDFVDENENGTEDIWWILEGKNYPRLWWELILEN